MFWFDSHLQRQDQYQRKVLRVLVLPLMVAVTRNHIVKYLLKRGVLCSSSDQTGAQSVTCSRVFHNICMCTCKIICMTVYTYGPTNTDTANTNTVMRRITTFRSTTGRIYDGGPKIL
jgi:hypothetical protein